MSDLIWLSRAQMRRIEPYFPLSHGVARVDDRRVISGIIFVIRNGLRWRDAPKDYGPHKTIYNRFIRWSRLGVFNRIFAELAAKGGKLDRLCGNSARHQLCKFHHGSRRYLLSRTLMRGFILLERFHLCGESPLKRWAVFAAGEVGLKRWDSADQIRRTKDAKHGRHQEIASREFGLKIITSIQPAGDAFKPSPNRARN